MSNDIEYFKQELAKIPMAEWPKILRAITEEIQDRERKEREGAACENKSA